MIEAFLAFTDAPAGTDDVFRETRHKMVSDQIASRGIDDDAVLDAMATVPRHRFVPEEQGRHAYDDMALPIGEGQTISQPFMVALMTRSLEIGSDSRVLEIGTGSGYQSAVLAEMGANVFTIERIQLLADRVRERLTSLGYADGIRFRVGDGSIGWPAESPFDGILVTAGAPSVPRTLRDQLSPGGRLVIPVGKHGYQDLLVVTRIDSMQFEERRVCACTFVPLLGEEGWPVG